MKLLSSVVVLGCNNVDQVLDFYQQAFQFVVIKQRKTEAGLDWVYLRSGDVLLMLEKHDRTEHVMGSGNRLYLYCDDAATMHHFLKARSIQVSELRQTDYTMYEFDTVDPEGHKLTIGQKITEK